MDKTTQTETSDLDPNTEGLSSASTTKSIEIVKQLQEEKMVAIEPLYINVGKSDAHGDGVTDENIDQLVKNFNDNIENISGNIHHNFNTDTFYPLKAYRTPFDVYVGDPSNPDEMIFIEEGQPIVELQFVDKAMWERRKSGVLGSVSIGCKAARVDNPDYEGED